MTNIDKNKNKNKHHSDIGRYKLKADCENCFGFCCVALYFSASEGFPKNKEAGKPCVNLQEDYKCKVHGDLGKLGYKGCTAFDCFGAGQRVAMVTYGGQDWRRAPELAGQMYDAFSVMRQLHEMLWYLTEALLLKPTLELQDELKSMLEETERFTLLSPEKLLAFDMAAQRARVSPLLSSVSELVRARFKARKSASSERKKTFGRGMDLIGADLRKADLRGENLRGSYLIASNLRSVDLSGADLLGADLRDADMRGANLEQAIFLTQAQVNTAKGDLTTRLPKFLEKPAHWTI